MVISTMGSGDEGKSMAVVNTRMLPLVMCTMENGRTINDTVVVCSHGHQELGTMVSGSMVNAQVVECFISQVEIVMTVNGRMAR